MEVRKLISFGKNSFVISLPKPWVIQNGLKKGDLIYVEEGLNNLELYPGPIEEPKDEKEIVINVKGKNLKRIQREIIGAYIQNYKTIIFIGDEIKDKAKGIQSFVQKLVALEIMEQDSKRVVAKDFLNVDDISMGQIIKKMDIITRSMLKDCKEMFNVDNSESIYLRDNDVNKFRFLIYRIIWFALEHPSLMTRKLKVVQRDLFNFWWISFSIESIADHTKRISRYLKEIKLDKKEQTLLVDLLSKIEIMYIDLMKAYHTSNVETAHLVIEQRFEMLQSCDTFCQENKDASGISFLMYEVKSLIVAIHTIGRIIYQGMPG
jgi:phosphate uptake regulator